MQNAQNTAEIQQRVINLVELYRTKVGKESKFAKDLAEEYKNQYDNEIDFAYALHEQGIDGYVLDIHIPEEAIDEIRVNEQLLGYFYKKVARESADKEVTDYFLAEKFDSSVFKCEEESFLVSHFREMVNYIIQTPNNNLSAVEGDDRNDLYLLPTEILDLIKERVAMPTGAKIYNPFTGFAQLACIYKDCSFLCEESYMPYFVRWNTYCKKLRETEHIVEHEVNDYKKLNAWMKVALYANGVDASVIINGSVPQQYDAVMSYIPYIPSEIPANSQLRTVYDLSEPDMINKIMMSYQNLAEGGKMVLILPTEYLWEKEALFSEGKTLYALELGNLWKQMVDDKSLVEIIQLPSVMGKSFYDEEHSIIIAEKGRREDDITFTDARFASMKSDGKVFKQVLDVNVLHSMVDNGGMDPNTGLRKYVQVRTEFVDFDLLVPQVYVIEKPADYDSPVPLTELCSLVTSHVYDVQENLPEDTPWVKSEDLSENFHGSLDIASLDIAACPNNPSGWNYGNRKLNNMFMGKNRYSEKDIRISIYRNCKYIDGKSDAILFKISKEGISVAVIEATGKGIAISPNIHVLLLNVKIDALSLTALLKTPMVYRQIEAYEKYGLYGAYGHLKDVLVPTSKRIIGDEKHRILLEQKALKEKDEKLATQKTEYINEVRMRKHDIRPHLRQLASSERLMLHYIDNASDMEELKRNLRNQIEHSHVALTSISTIVDHLSDAEQFGIPELLNIDSLLTDIEVNHDDAEGFVIEYDCDKESFRKQGFVIPNISEQWELAKEQGLDMVKFIQAKSKECLPLFISIAPVDFQRMADNIIENARKHGFTDHTRTDYYIGIDLSMNTERNMYQIDFCNNGTPLPDGMTKARYGLKGEKAGKTSGTGSGGYIVKSIVSHYGGDYDIFCKDSITTIRIYLPIATI